MEGRIRVNKCDAIAALYTVDYSTIVLIDYGGPPSTAMGIYDMQEGPKKARSMSPTNLTASERLNRYAGLAV